MSTESNQAVIVYSETTPNPEALKFVSNRAILPGQSLDFPDIESAENSPLAEELFGFPYVNGVFIANNFVSVTKTKEYEWVEITTTLREFIKGYIESGKEILKEGYQPKENASEEVKPTTKEEEAIIKEIKEVLDQYVKPAVEMDGGAILFRSYKEGVVSLVLQGSCSGCPSSTVTLKAGIEGMLKQRLPEVKEVIAIEG